MALYVHNGNILDEATGRLLAEIADAAAGDWRRPDNGRGGSQSCATTRRPGSPAGAG